VHAGLFQEADTNGDGTVDRREFVAVLSHSHLDLSSTIIDRVLAEADDNDDGVIEYKCVTAICPVYVHCIALHVATQCRSNRLQGVCPSFDGHDRSGELCTRRS
jgi:EF-hand domain pair